MNPHKTPPALSERAAFIAFWGDDLPAGRRIGRPYEVIYTLQTVGAACGRPAPLWRFL